MDSSNGRLKGDGGVCVRAPTEQTQHPASSLSLTSIPLDCAGQKKALLIGIRTSRTGGYPELKGAHDDVHKMQKLLLDVYVLFFLSFFLADSVLTRPVSTRYNYTPTEITILMDDGHHIQPTRDNIVRPSMQASVLRLPDVSTACGYRRPCQGCEERRPLSLPLCVYSPPFATWGDN
jgi:hypothetical protein